MDTELRKKVEELFASEQFCCAETALYLMAEAGGKKGEEHAGYATGFCAGVSRTKGQCGALSGVIMGMGIYAGRFARGEDNQLIFALTQELIERFNTRFNTTNCWDLTECDFQTSEGQNRFKEQNIIETCRDYTAFCVENGVELLHREGLLPE